MSRLPLIDTLSNTLPTAVSAVAPTTTTILQPQLAWLENLETTAPFWHMIFQFIMLLLTEYAYHLIYLACFWLLKLVLRRVGFSNTVNSLWLPFKAVGKAIETGARRLCNALAYTRDGILQSVDQVVQLGLAYQQAQVNTLAHIFVASVNGWVWAFKEVVDCIKYAHEAYVNRAGQLSAEAQLVLLYDLFGEGTAQIRDKLDATDTKVNALRMEMRKIATRAPVIQYAPTPPQDDSMPASRSSSPTGASTSKPRASVGIFRASRPIRLQGSKATPHQQKPTSAYVSRVHRAAASTSAFDTASMHSSRESSPEPSYRGRAIATFEDHKTTLEKDVPYLSPKAFLVEVSHYEENLKQVDERGDEQKDAITVSSSSSSADADHLEIPTQEQDGEQKSADLMTPESMSTGDSKPDAVAQEQEAEQDQVSKQEQEAKQERESKQEQVSKQVQEVKREQEHKIDSNDAAQSLSTIDALVKVSTQEHEHKQETNGRTSSKNGSLSVSEGDLLDMPSPPPASGSAITFVESSIQSPVQSPFVSSAKIVAPPLPGLNLTTIREDEDMYGSPRVTSVKAVAPPSNLVLTPLPEREELGETPPISPANTAASSSPSSILGPIPEGESLFGSEGETELREEEIKTSLTPKQPRVELNQEKEIKTSLTPEQFKDRKNVMQILALLPPPELCHTVTIVNHEQNVPSVDEYDPYAIDHNVRGAFQDVRSQNTGYAAMADAIKDIADGSNASDKNSWSRGNEGTSTTSIAGSADKQKQLVISTATSSSSKVQLPWLTPLSPIAAKAAVVSLTRHGNRMADAFYRAKPSAFIKTSSSSTAARNLFADIKPLPPFKPS